jgi:hypothetical protein
MWLSGTHRQNTLLKRRVLKYQGPEKMHSLRRERQTVPYWAFGPLIACSPWFWPNLQNSRLTYYKILLRIGCKAHPNEKRYIDTPPISEPSFQDSEIHDFAFFDVLALEAIF